MSAGSCRWPWARDTEAQRLGPALRARRDRFLTPSPSWGLLLGSAPHPQDWTKTLRRCPPALPSLLTVKLQTQVQGFPSLGQEAFGEHRRRGRLHGAGSLGSATSSSPWPCTQTAEILKLECTHVGSRYRGLGHPRVLALGCCGDLAHLAVSGGLSWPIYSCVTRPGAALARGFRAPWQRVQLIPVACLFLGNRLARGPISVVSWAWQGIGSVSSCLSPSV